MENYIIPGFFRNFAGETIFSFPNPRGQKLKILATLTLEDVPKTRLCDPGFWALAFGQWVPNATEYHRAEADLGYLGVMCWYIGL